MKQTTMMRRLAVLVGTVLVAVLALSGMAWAATTPLAVTRMVPGSGATEVARTVNVQAYFNHDMKASTFTSSTSTFKIRKQGTTTWLGATRSVNNTISPTSTNGASQSVATLNPDANLAANTTYQVMIVGGSSGVKDVNGNALSANKSWTFKTVTPPETTINSGPTGDFASTLASFTFSSSKLNSTFKCSLDGSTFAACSSPKDYPGPLSQGNHTFRVRAIDATGTQDPTPASRSWSVDTNVPSAPAIASPQEKGFVSANFTLSGTAEPNVTVKVFEGTTSKGTTQANGSSVWSKALSGVGEGTHNYTATATDAAGNTSSVSNTRTLTVDTIAPTVNNVSPEDAATGVSPTTNVTAIFSEGIDPTTLTTSTFTLKEQGSSTQLGATVSYDATANKATLDPSADLTLNTTYTATLSTGLKDAAGNTLAQERSWTFTTDIARPTVVGYAPTGSPNPPGLSTNVTATFSTAMDPSTITTSTFTLTRTGTSDPLAAQVTYDSASKTATLDPSANLSGSTNYTAVIKSGSNGVKNLQGNSLAQDFSWTFMPCDGGIVLPAQSIVPQGPVVCG
jgi:Bacterial Ig-like domain